jgi:hypothetical protein
MPLPPPEIVAYVDWTRLGEIARTALFVAV